MRSRLADLAVRATSVAASGIALISAWIDPRNAGSVSSQTPPAAVRIPSLVIADTTADSLIEHAVGRNPFSSRDQITTESPATPPPAVNEPLLRVLGTVVDSAGGSFALCQLGATQAVIVRVGQRIGDYELRRIEKGSVVFAGSDGASVELRVPRAGA